MSGLTRVRRVRRVRGIRGIRGVRAPERALPAVALAAVAATIAAGLVLQFAAGVTLGTPSPPFLMSWRPKPRPEALAGIAVAGVLTALVPWAIDRVRSSAAFAALAYSAALTLGLAVNAARLGVAGWTHVFVLGPGGAAEAHFEYLPALPYLRGGVAHYVRRFPALLPDLPTHVKGNPPGPLVVMHLLGIDDATRLTVACVAVGALCAPLAYLLGRELYDERRGRVAAALAVLSPSLVLFGVTSVDYAFAAIGTAGAWLLVSRRWSARAAGCAVLAAASFMSWVLLAMPVWAVLCVGRRDGVRAAALTALGAGAAIGALTLALHLAWGYDPIAIVLALAPIYSHGIASRRPYWFWVLGSPAAFLAMLGAPIAWLALRAVARREPAAVALAAVILVSAIAGFTKAETERIWLPFVGLACVAAASSGVTRLRVVLAFLATQAIVIEILFRTVW